ncbi:MAG: sugar ABC transporter [Oligoflexales bacterium]|nr:sugar ABC transporter [Oligoflexales bacterium]
MLKLIVISCLFQSQIHASVKYKKILIIESYHSTLNWDQAYIQAIKDALGPNYKIKTFAMDTKRVKPSQYEMQAEKAWSAYLSFKPDLIISGDDNALKLLAKKYQSVETPVVYLGINNNPRHYFNKVPSNVTGVLERPLLFRSILKLKKMLGTDIKKVILLFDSGTTANIIFQDHFKDKSKISIGDIEVHIKLKKSYKEWQATVLDLKSKKFDAAIVGLYHTIVDDSGNNEPSEELLAWTNKNSGVPLFAFWKVTVGKGMAIGGLVLDPIDQGAIAANLVKKILEGKKRPSDLFPVKPEDGELVFSQHELRRFKISLPKSWISSVTFVE